MIVHERPRSIAWQKCFRETKTVGTLGTLGTLGILLLMDPLLAIRKVFRTGEVG